MKNLMNPSVFIFFGSLFIFSCNTNSNENEESTAVAEQESQTSLLAENTEFQEPEYHPTNQQLYDTIMELDEAMWEAYSSGNAEEVSALMSEDFKFYHDQGGVVEGKEQNVAMLKSFFRENPSVKGTSIEGTNEVYEIPGFGALQVGHQQFFSETRPDGTAPARTITLWKKTEEGWKQESLFSMHAHPADNFEQIEVVDRGSGKKIPMKDDFKYGFLNDLMKSTPADTADISPTYEMLLVSPGGTTDTIFSTGTLHRSSDSEAWLRSSEDIVSKYDR